MASAGAPLFELDELARLARAAEARIIGLHAHVGSGVFAVDSWRETAEHLAAAAAVLLMYGTGPIKGFAVSLLIGIVTTLFTAVFVCRLFFDAYLRRLEDSGRSTISI